VTSDPASDDPRVVGWNHATIAAVLDAGDVRGVRLWPAAPPHEQFQRAAEDLGWVYRWLDTRHVTDKGGYLEACRAGLQLPGYMGRNWDALEEALDDLPGSWPTGTPGVLVLWSGWSKFAQAAPRDFATALDIWHDAVAVWRSDQSHAALVLPVGQPDLSTGEDRAVATLPRVRKDRRGLHSGYGDESALH